jgi:hypothetical protein
MSGVRTDLATLQAQVEALRVLVGSSLPAQSVVSGTGVISAAHLAPRTATVRGVGVTSARATLRPPTSTVAGVGATSALNA